MLESWPPCLRFHVETINSRELLAIPAWEHEGCAQTQLFRIINFLSKALCFPIWESVLLMECWESYTSHREERVGKVKKEIGACLFS